MARIETYKKDTQLGLDDFLLGSDADNINVTRNYLLRGIFSTFKNSLGLSSIEYVFAGSGDPELNEEDRGYFTTNSNTTLAGAISTIRINKNDLNNISIESIITTIEDNISSFMLTLFKPSSSGQIFYFKVTDITDNGDYYVLDVENFVGGNYLIDGTTYTLNFDLAGVPSELTESDPIFTASPSYNITNIDISNWNTVYSWGDHSVAGYQSKLDGDGIVKSSSGIISYLPDNSTNWNTAYSWGDHASIGYLTEESDPIFIASPAASISTLKISQWDTAFGWGDHSVAGYLTSFTESDPIFTGSVAYSIDQGDIDSWNSAYSWGNHSIVGYLTEESDPIFIASPAASITTSFISNWNAAFTWGDWSTGVDKTFIDALNVDADTLDSLESSQFLRSDTSDTIDGNLTVLGNSTSANTVIRDLIFSNDGYTSSDKRSIILRHRTGTVAGEDTSDLQIITRDNGDFIYGLRQNQDGLTYDGGKVWHEGNDGSGSGLDADLLDGLDSTNFVRNDYPLDSNGVYTSTFRGAVTNLSNSSDDLNGSLPTAYGSLFMFQGSTVGRAFSFYKENNSITNIQVGLSNSSGVPTYYKLWHSGNDGSGSGLDADVLDGVQGSNYARTDVAETFNSKVFVGGAFSNTTVGNLQINGDGANEGLVLWNESGAVTKRIWSDSTNNRLYITAGVGTTSGVYMDSIGNFAFQKDVHIESGAITRGAHNAGYLEGSYNNVGGNANQSNPIYVIGSGYVPNTTTLGSMYGIGYCAGSASFIGSDELGASPNTGGWGLYVATTGYARVFLDSTYGRGYFKSYIYASDFIIHSDRRKKENIRDVEIIDKPIHWRTFDKKEEWGGDKDKCGVIAQELQETHPQFVDDNDPDSLSVRYTDLFAHELAKKDKQVKELEDRVERLEALVEILIKEK